MNIVNIFEIEESRETLVGPRFQQINSNLPGAHSDPNSSKKMEETLLRMNFLHSASHILYPISPQLSQNAIQRMVRLSRLHVDAINNVSLSDAVTRQFCNQCGILFVPGENCNVSVRSKRQRRRKMARKERAKNDFTGEQPVEMDISDSIELDTTKPALSEVKQRKSGQARTLAQRMVVSSPPSLLSSRANAQLNNVIYSCHTCGSQTVFPGTTRANIRELSGEKPKETKQGTPVSAPTSKLETKPSTPKPVSSPTPSPTISASQAKKNRGKVKDLQGLLAKQREQKASSGGAKLEDFLAELTK